MGNRREIDETLDDTAFGSSLDDLAEGDLHRGYSDAAPDGNYEGSLDGREVYEFPPNGSMRTYKGGTLHPGQIEPDGHRATHDGEVEGEYGFLRRPRRRGDVERT